MLTSIAKKELEKQQYRIIGNHSAVKICHWTKSMIRGNQGCYKLKFYGIMSSQCLQMTTSLSCANQCVFCWRDYKAPVSKEWKWRIDDPELILTESLKMHHQLMKGFNNKSQSYKLSNRVKHVALSLTGEPIAYPKINEIISIFNREGISTFLVTNAQYPEKIKNLKPVTQLYISLDAPNKKLLKEIDKPLFKDFWSRLNKSLEYLSGKKQRTCIRLTLIKNLNILEPEKYAELIKKGNPDFIEVKAYMHMGASQENLDKSSMPNHKEILEFSEKLNQFLPDYGLVSEHTSSRVVLLAKNKFKINGKWHTWIDFQKYNQLVNNNGEFSTEDYLKQTPIKFIDL